MIAGCCLLFDAGLKTAFGVLLVGSAVAFGIGGRSAVRDPEASWSEARDECNRRSNGRLMFCIGCGASNLRHATFCRNCGEEVQSIAAQNPEPGKTEVCSENPKPTMNDLSEELEDQTPIEVQADHVQETASSEGGLPVSHVEWSENRREYAGLFQRLLAYLCDLTVVYFILFAAELFWGFAEGFGLMHRHITEDERWGCPLA